MADYFKTLTYLEEKERKETEKDLAYISKIHYDHRQNQAKAKAAELRNQHQINAQISSGLVSENDKYKTIKLNLENELKDLNITINSHSGLKTEDKTEDGQDLLQFTYQSTSNEMDWNKLAQSNVADKMEFISNQGLQLRSEIAQLEDHLKKYKTWDQKILDNSKKLYKSEDAQGASADWMLDDRELEKFIAVNRADYDQMVNQFGGGKEGENEVRNKLKRHFTQFTNEQLKTVNMATSIQATKLANIKRKQELGLLPLTAQQLLQAEFDKLDTDYGEANLVLTQMSKKFTDEQIKDEPIFQYLQGVEIVKGANKAGFLQGLASLDYDMVAFVKEIDENEGIAVFGADTIPSEFRNDYMKLALWHSGQIVKIDDSEFYKNNPDIKWAKDRKPDYVSKDGTKYVTIEKPELQMRFAYDRLKDYELSDKWNESSTVDLINGSINFFQTYVKAHQMHAKMEESERMYKNSFGVNAYPTLEPREPINNDLIVSNDITLIKDLLEFGEKNNMTQEKIREEATNNNQSIRQYMDDQNEKMGRKYAGISKQRADQIYNETGDLQGFINGIPLSEQGYDLVEQLKEINNIIGDSASEYLNADGDAQLQRDRKIEFNNTGFLGEEYEALHEDAAILIDQLKDVKEIANKVGEDRSIWDYYFKESEFKDDGSLRGISKKYPHRKQYTDEIKREQENKQIGIGDWIYDPIIDDDIFEYDQIDVTP